MSISEIVLAVLSILMSAQGVPVHSADTHVGVSPAVVFMAAGDVGGGVLELGTEFPPTTHGYGMLIRGEDWIQAQISTSGLPEGTYTVWWIVFNNPAACDGPCDMDDLLNEDAQVSVFYAAGGMVRENGIGNFVARYTIGDFLGLPGPQHVLGDGMFDPMRAEIHNVIKYHGPASDDPEVLSEQVYTLLGACTENANAVDLGEPFGVHCFDPQVIVYPPPAQ
jgi:hypothetical protein